MILNVCPNPSIDTYAWMSNFLPGDANRIYKMKEFPGGKGTHVAMAIAELGGDSVLLGNWAGQSGNWIKRACEKRGLSTLGIEVGGNNRKCYTFRSEEESLNDTELLEPGPEMNDDDWEKFKAIFTENIPGFSLVSMSGSWPTNAPADAYHQLIKIANAQGTKVILDCGGQQLEEAVKSGFFGLHLNEREATEFCGSPRFEALLKKLDGKVELVVLSKGSKGLQLYYKGEIIKANVKLDQVISTVGSGDCLTAGVAFAVDNNMIAGEIAAYGAACGAANCLTEDLGILRKEDVLNLLSEVKFNTTRNEF